MNVSKITPIKPRPKLTRFGLAPAAAPVPDTAFFFNWRVGARGPRERYATAEEALIEARRLRKVLGPEHIVRTYQAVEIVEDKK